MRIIFSLLVVGLLSTPALAKLENVARDPYIGAIVVDADTGNVLFSDKADQKGYPASVLKLMDLLVILDKIEEGRIKLTDIVRTTAEASRTGGSQVYLKEHEEFTVEELLYALMVQSANDAAVALAIHIAGSKDGFVALMNEKAKEIGMTSTRFNSVHGLPPSTGQEPDVTTARDLSLLCLELLKYPDVLTYTSVKTRPFRPEANPPFMMQNHNKLLWSFDGCDGFKTGYFTAAGFSIAATAKRGGNRVIAVVLGSTSRQVRDAKTAELLSRGFLIVPPKAEPPPPAVAPPPPPAPEPAMDVADKPVEDEDRGAGVPVTWLIVGVVAGALISGGIMFWLLRRNASKGDFVQRH